MGSNGGMPATVSNIEKLIACRILFDIIHFGSLTSISFCSASTLQRGPNSFLLPFFCLGSRAQLLLVAAEAMSAAALLIRADSIRVMWLLYA